MSAPQCSVEKQHEPGLDIIVTRRDALSEWFVLASPMPGDSETALFERAARALQVRNASITNQFVWHRADIAEAARQSWEKVLGPTNWPLSWMIDPHGRQPFGGTTIRAVSGVTVEPLRIRDRVVGAMYDASYARYLLLGGLRDASTRRTPQQQAGQVFEDIAACLEAAGMRLGDVLRTWFFNDRILDWYDGFNRIRTAFFRQHGLPDAALPASTGIGAANLAGAALTASLIAVRPLDDRCQRRSVDSPRQCPATGYGSRFSRATELETPDRRHLFVSGTASIAPDGTTSNVHDVQGQTRETLRAIDEILTSRDMQWSDVLQGVAYLRRAEDYPAAMACLEAFDWLDAPILWSNNTVCRDDLLFELEVQAARPRR